MFEVHIFDKYIDKFRKYLFVHRDGWGVEREGKKIQTGLDAKVAYRLKRERERERERKRSDKDQRKTENVTTI